MVFALLFPLLGLTMIALAATHAHHSGGWWLLAWMGLSFITVGIAYAGAGPRVFGKTPRGARRWWAYPLLLPYLLYLHLFSWIRSRVSAAPACHEVLPNLWVGRWPGRSVLPPHVTLVIDMTAEFTRAPSTRQLDYVCYPTLDHRAPTPQHARAAVAQILAHPRGVYLHCAYGHGRSAAIAALVAIAQNRAVTSADAQTLLRKTRRHIRFSRHQHALIDSLQAIPCPPASPASARH